MKIRVNKRVILISLVFIGVILLGFSLFAFLSRWETSRASVEVQYPDYSKQVLTYQGETYAPREDIETVLFIGVDKFRADTDVDSYNNAQQADALVLVILNHTDQTYTALQLNRDTMAEITMLGVRGEDAGTFTGQLALAHTYGSGGRDSCRNTVSAVSNFLYSVDIDHFVSLTMDAVPIINDLVGGVQVELLSDFSAIDSEMCKGAVLTLDGEQALSYVRGRKDIDDGSNLSRMERQRQYLGALRPQLQACMEDSDSFLLNLLSKTAPYTQSDCTVEQLSGILNKVAAYQDGGIISIQGEAVKGEQYIEFYADEAMLKSLVIQYFYERYSEEPS